MKIFESGSHLIDQPTEFDSLTIMEDAQLVAPQGKYLAMTVNGMGKKPEPGTYHGEVRIIPAAYHDQGPYPSVNRRGPIPMKTAVSVVDNRVVTDESVLPLVWGGRVNGSSASDIYIATDEEDFAGILVDGESNYTVNNASFDFSGPGYNDFVGQGAGVAAIGSGSLTINHSRFKFNSITRCAVHAGGTATVIVNNSRFENLSPNCEMGDWSWGIGVRGTNRLCQLADDANVYYNSCHMVTNGWGVLSVDGSNYASMSVKDCYLELSGPYAHGYGIFCIGPTKVNIDHSVIDVYGYPLMLMGMENKAEVNITNGSLLTGRRYGIHAIGDTGSKVNILHSEIKTEKANLVVKGATGTVFNMDNSRLSSDQGVILQLMDNDDPSMGSAFIDVSMYKTMKDTPIPGRDLSSVTAKDVTLNIRNCCLKGDFFNSTTDLKRLAGKVAPKSLSLSKGVRAPGALAGSMHSAADGDAPQGPPPMPPEAPEGGPMMGGPDPMSMADKSAPKNLGIYLFNSSVTGQISSALQQYRVDYITEQNREELCNVSQTPAPPVNNGVILELDGESRWEVTGSCYLTGLKLSPGSVIAAPEGKSLTMTVDGAAQEPKPGEYTGQICISLK